MLGDLVEAQEGLRGGVLATLEEATGWMAELRLWRGKMVIPGGDKVGRGEKGSRALGKKDIMSLMLLGGQNREISFREERLTLPANGNNLHFTSYLHRSRQRSG